MAEMNGVKREDFRSGAYAMRLRRTPASPVARTATRNAAAVTPHPIVPGISSRKSHPKTAPSITISEWAKLIMRRTPYTMV